MSDRVGHQGSGRQPPARGCQRHCQGAARRLAAGRQCSDKTGIARARRSFGPGQVYSDVVVSKPRDAVDDRAVSQLRHE